MRKRFKRYLTDRCNVRCGDRGIIAVSGGADSSALAHLLVDVSSELSLTLSVLSIDHGLRPETKSELQAVRGLCEDLGTSMVATSVQTMERAIANRLCIEDAARQERMEALEAHRGLCRADWIAVGHTRSDQAETVLQRLRRGTGIDGLACMLPRRDHVIRPLLFASRDEVRAYLVEQGRTWCEDPSNRDPRFERSRVRERLLPHVDEREVADIAAIAADIRAQLERGESAWLRRYGGALDKGCFIERRGLQFFESPLRSRLLRHATMLNLVSRSPLTRQATRAVVELTTGKAGRALSLHGMEALCPGGALDPIVVVANRTSPPGCRELAISRAGEFRFETLRMTVVVGGKQPCSPVWGLVGDDDIFIIRQRMAGDRMATNGKKLKRYWQEVGLWSHLRDWVPLVIRDTMIEWTALTPNREGEGILVSFQFDEGHPLRDWLTMVR